MSTFTSPEWEDRLLSRIQPPRIPARRVSVSDYGVIPDAPTAQTSALQRAVDETAAAGGGCVVIPAGRYLTGSLCLKSRIELHLEAGAVLAFLPPESGAYPLAFSHWEGSPCWNYRALIYALDAHDVALTGPGTLDGQADARHWWNWHHQTENAWSREGENPQAAARGLLREMNEQGVAVDKRVFGDGHFLRPNFVQMLRCSRVLISDVTLVNSPMWLINPVMCRSVTLRGLTLASHGPNNDGCDPESCDGVLIERCRFDNGDDCISIKSGRDRDGRLAARPCENLVIRNNTFAGGHGGVALGSEASGGIRNLIVHHNCFDSDQLTYALRLKTNARRGGVMERIWFHHCTIRRVSGAAIHGTMFYEDGRNGSWLPRFRELCIEDITAHGGEYGVFLEAFPEVPLEGLTLRRIVIEGAQAPFRAAAWQGAVMEDVTINGLSYPRPTQVRVLGVPAPGSQVRADCALYGAETPVQYRWLLDGEVRGEGSAFTPGPESIGRALTLSARAGGRETLSRAYTVLPAPGSDAGRPGDPGSVEAARLRTRGLLPAEAYAPDSPITRRELARMAVKLAFVTAELPCIADLTPDDPDEAVLKRVVGAGILPLDNQRRVQPDAFLTRREMATVAMMCCGVSYRNASTTMPVCADAEQVGPVYGTNVARSLYFGFQALDGEGRFRPLELVNWREAVLTLNRAADFARV